MLIVKNGYKDVKIVNVKSGDFLTFAANSCLKAWKLLVSFDYQYYA